MSDGKVRNRWFVVLGAILIQSCLGAIYAWSVFTPALTADPYNFTDTQTQWVFGVGLAAFAIVMIVAGRMQAKFPPRNVAIAGGAVLGLGYVAASFMGTSFLGHLICIGLVGGSGIGLAYVVPIAVGVKWFPDKKGMLSGLAVAGFGFGALLWVQLAGPWGQLITRLDGVANVFLVYGIAFAAIVFLGSVWMVNPPEGWKPDGWQPPMPSPGSAASGSLDLSSSEMLRTPQFYMLWSMFAAGSMAGLMVIGCIALFGIDALRSAGLDEQIARARAGTAMGVFFALTNGLGRIGWGMISDKLGRKMSLLLLFLVQGVVMLLFYQMGFRASTLFLGSAIIGFNFGGTLALFPAATADCFGNKNVGTNYGWMFTAYGVGGIVGPVLGGHFGDVAKEAAVAAGGQIDPSPWATPFIVAGIACLAAAGLALALRAPKT